MATKAATVLECERMILAVRGGQRRYFRSIRGEFLAPPLYISIFHRVREYA